MNLPQGKYKLIKKLPWAYPGKIIDAGDEIDFGWEIIAGRKDPKKITLRWHWIVINFPDYFKKLQK